MNVVCCPAAIRGQTAPPPPTHEHVSETVRTGFASAERIDSVPLPAYFSLGWPLPLPEERLVTYWENGDLNVEASLVIAAGLFLGAWGGAKLAHQLPTVMLQRLFAVFIMVMAVGLWIEAGSA